MHIFGRINSHIPPLEVVLNLDPLTRKAVDARGARPQRQQGE